MIYTRRLILLSILLVLPISMGAHPSTPTVKWEWLPQSSDSAAMVQRFTVTAHDSIATLLFNQLPRPIKASSPGDTVSEICTGYFAVTSDKFRLSQPAVIDLELGWALRAISHSPESFHALTPGGNIIPVVSEGMAMHDAVPLYSRWQNWCTTPDSIFRLNEKIARGNTPGVYDIIPSFKNVRITKGDFRKGTYVETRIISNPNPEYYRIVLTPRKGLVEGASQEAINRALHILDSQLLEPNNGVIPCAEIEDFPDYPHRGVMIDIARNYMSPAELKKLTSLLSDYRLNRLHFHFTDDEVWRLEIPGLPELTRVGSRRGYTTDSRDFLPQVFSGDGNPNSSVGTANGYFTREDFIDLLRHCHNLGIEVIPEVESPGHARAAIKAMEARYRDTGDDTYRLIIPGDTSRYTSAQRYHDNLMNPAAPGTYRFIEKIVDELAAMYREAGVPLPGIHLGGDEVPEGAWDGSPEAMALAKEKGVTGRHGLQGEYVKKITGILRNKGIPLYGWQDIYTGYDHTYHREVAPAVGGVNCWVTDYRPSENVALQGITNGYPVILSNVDYFYLDMLYTRNPEERGLYWGGIVDELRTLSGYPDSICPPASGVSGRIIGVQGQLFGETIRKDQDAERLIFPKAAGLAERGWNGKPTYTEEDFNILIGEKELPRLYRRGVEAHLRQPGIMIENDKILMNSPYPSAEIHYTTDGSAPTENSPIYRSPVPFTEDIMQVNAILAKDGHHSVATRLSIRK